MTCMGPLSAEAEGSRVFGVQCGRVLGGGGFKRFGFSGTVGVRPPGLKNGCWRVSGLEFIGSGVDEVYDSGG